MPKEDFLYKDITYQIRGACFWIWKEFKNAFKESIIDNALALELGKRGLKVEKQKKINIYYQNRKVGTYVPDQIIIKLVLLELKRNPILLNKMSSNFGIILKALNIN